MPANRLDVEQRVRDLRQQIAALQQELSEWERAAALLRGLDGLPPDPQPLDRLPGDAAAPAATGDLSRHTTAEAAEAVMGTDPSAQWNYGDVAQAAIARGYTGRPGSSEKAVRDSFRRIMMRNPDMFQALGRGRFRLKASRRA